MNHNHLLLRFTSPASGRQTTHTDGATHQPQADPGLAEGGAAADQPDDEHHHGHANDDHSRQQGVLVLQKVVVALVGVDDVRPNIAEACSCRLKCSKEK